jgi:hypothetical protein
MNKNKKTRCSWRGSVIPKKNKTYKVQFVIAVNDERSVIDVDTSINPDQTINVHGQTTYIKGNKTTHTPIHLDHYNVKDAHKLPNNLN